MKERNRFIVFLERIFDIKIRKKTKEEKSEELKRKMCFEARKMNMCKGSQHDCNYCAWRPKEKKKGTKHE